MQKSKVLEFGEFRFTKKELRSLDKRIFSLLVGSSVAANDVAILQRLVIFHIQEAAGSEIIVTYANINSLVLLRLLAAKVYEYIFFIEGSALALRRKPTPALDTFLARADGLLLLKNDPEFAVVKALRDNVTHHYHGATAISNLNSFEEGHVFSTFHHELFGNSLSPLGEEIGTFGLLNSRTDGIDLKKILAWTTKAASEIIDFQQSTYIQILETFFPKKNLIVRKVPVEQRFIGDPNTHAPVFYVTEPLSAE